MKPETQALVLAAVAKWRSRLRLGDWSFTYAWDSDETGLAKVVTEALYRRAKFHFAPSFPEMPKDGVAGPWLTLEKAVVHELTHVVITRLDSDAISAIKALKASDAAERQAIDRLYDANEYVTETVACIVWEAYEGSPWDAELSIEA